MQPNTHPQNQTGVPLQGAPVELTAEDFRSHWNDNYSEDDGDFDDYSYAYLYGAGLTPRLSGREWADIEPAVRLEWDERYPESAWERFKAAVRHGWEKATHRTTEN
jgi:hypothetical protein